MALLKSELKRISIHLPIDLLNQLDNHLKNFAFGNRSQWLAEAIREKMSRERTFITENNKDEEDDYDL